MDFHHLRTFVAVAEEGNLTRASERLFTSQPAISAHIKALEEELGVTLFERTPRGMVLTRGGERLLGQAREALEALGQVTRTARAIQGKVLGTARVGLNTDSHYLRVSELHHRLAGAHPDLVLELIQNISGCIVEDIRGGRLEGGFFFGMPADGELTALKLRDARLRIAAPAAWRDRVENAGWDTLATLPWIFPTEQCPYIDLMRSLFPAGGPQPCKVVVASGESAMNTLVRSGAGLTLIREDEAEEGLADGSLLLLEGRVYTLPLCFGYPARRAGDPMLRALVEAVRAIWSLEADVPAATDAV
ncbi:MAG: LysR family transcriptional regulator [Gammaproteobacteria bacterium]|nr:LysR family transcriptional regulator [Gammaproteobacteria bacterium]